MKEKYGALFEPISIGAIRMKNRISMPPMYMRYATAFGEVTERTIEHYVRRAKGGVGLIIIENTCIDWEYGRIDGCPVTIHDDRYVHGLHELASAVLRHDVPILTQLQHVGRQQLRANIGGRQPLAPSAVKSKVGGDMPRAMTEEEIEKAIQAYAEGARRSKEAGFSGAEVHGAHGYLPCQFISPLTNKRRDRWGGSFANRCRFAVELLRRIRETVGPDYPIFFRFSAEEWNPGSLSLEEGLKYAAVLEREGIDCLDVSGGYYETVRQFPSQGDSFDDLAYLAAAVKAQVGIPVIGVGSLGWDPEVAANTIKSGKADIVHFGRELLADPDLPKKLLEDRTAEIRKCIRCNECLGCLDKHHSVLCVLNPEQGYEYKKALQPANKVKKIAVVGAGLAGMEFAVTASKRGHRVILLEKEPVPGGLAHKALAVRYKHPEISSLLHYYQTMLGKTGVDFRANTEANFDLLSALEPDMVVLATGAVPADPAFPGSKRARNAVVELASGGATLGRTICIVGGSGVGIDAAINFAELGKSVVVVEKLGEIGGELAYHLRMHLLERLRKLKVRLLALHRVVEITAEGVIAEHNNQQKLIPSDHVLVAVGFKRIDTTDLEAKLSRQNWKFIKIGSHRGAGRFMDAIHSGYWAAVDV